MSKINKNTARARWIVGIAGFAIIAWGYNNYSYPANLALMTLGALFLIAAIFRFFMPSRKDADPVKPHSTVQGGSNYGQGSSYLAGDAYKQGADNSKGSTYENEKGFDTQKD
jgi:hypothetical protein